MSFKQLYAKNLLDNFIIKFNLDFFTEPHQHPLFDPDTKEPINYSYSNNTFMNLLTFIGHFIIANLNKNI